MMRVQQVSCSTLLETSEAVSIKKIIGLWLRVRNVAFDAKVRLRPRETSKCFFIPTPCLENPSLLCTWSKCVTQQYCSLMSPQCTDGIVVLNTVCPIRKSSESWWWPMVTDDVFFSANTKSIVQTNTFCTMQVDKNVQNSTFHNITGGWITGLQTPS